MMKYARGSSVKSLSEALDRQLFLINPSSRHPRDRYKYYPGAAFIDTGRIKSAENWAIIAAQKEQQFPIVVTINVTPDNFPLLKRRIWNRREKPGGGLVGWVDLEFTPVEAHENLGESVNIDLSGLDMNSLQELGAEVGTLGIEGKFEYRELADIIQEIKTQIEGRRQLESPEGN